MQDIALVAAVITWFAWSGVNAAIADQKGRSGILVFLLSFFLSPWIGWAYIVAVPVKPSKSKAPEAQG